MKLGILVDNLRAVQKNYYMIQSLNNFISNSEHDAIVFYQEPMIPCAPIRFSVIQMIEAYSFDGAVIATSISLAQKLLNFPGPSRKIFYVWDLEWMENMYYHHQLSELFRHPDIQIITRSSSYAKKISDCWNIDLPEVVEDFNIEELVDKAERCPN